MDTLPPIPERPKYEPPEDKPHTHISLADLSEQERDDWFEKHGCDITRKLHEERKKSGYYTTCKCDGVKEYKDKQDREAKKQRDDDDNDKKRMRDRSKILEEHARQVEEDLKTTKASFESYKTQTEARLNKLASLIQQLMA